MRSFFVAVTSVVLSVGALAQSNGSSAVWIAPPVSASCPIGFSARQNSPTRMVQIARPPAPGAGTPSSPDKLMRVVPPQNPGLLLSFRPQEERAIMALRVVLHGHNATPRAMPVGLGSGTELKESVELQAGDGDHGLLESPVFFHKLTTVSWLELREIRYADGTTWHASEKSACRTAPDPFLLVATAH